MNNDEKYYKLEDLKIGMRVSVPSLSKIHGVCICLDKKTMVFDEDSVAHGTIVYIGNGDYTKEGIALEDVCALTFYGGYSSLMFEEE